MARHIQPATDEAIAVSITLPVSTGSGVRLTTLLAQGAIVTPAADLPSDVAIASTTADGNGPTGSTPQMRLIARRTVQAVIENHAAAFLTDALSTMPAAVLRTPGTTYASPAALNGVRRVYAKSAGAAQTVTVWCLRLGIDFTTDGEL